MFTLQVVCRFESHKRLGQKGEKCDACQAAQRQLERCVNVSAELRLSVQRELDKDFK